MRHLIVIALAACTTTPPEGHPPAAEPPPPWGVSISGGTMIVMRDGARAVIGDPDRDRVLSVKLATGAVSADIALDPGSEPGRLVEDGAHRIHIVLRGSGALLTFDPATGKTIAKRSVCSEPRGVAWESATDLVHVACATGELVSMPAAGGAPVRTLELGRDLRDVVVSGANIVVTKFRFPEVITIDATGAILTSVKPPAVNRFLNLETGTTAESVPTVAWRTIALPDGRLIMTHQRKRPLPQPLRVTTGGYGNESTTIRTCGKGPIESALTIFGPDPFPVAAFIQDALPIDIAASADQVAVITAATNRVQLISSAILARPDDSACGDPTTEQPTPVDDKLGTPTSVAFTPANELIVFYPELPALVIHAATPRTIKLPGRFGYSSARALFHRQGGVPMACASCHPEGGDDGQVWPFEFGPRRTMNLRGGILARAPYHWSGDMPDIPTLIENVFTKRMNGGALTRSENLSMGPWLDRLRAPAPKTNADTTAIARGQALFLDPAQGCINCHSGPMYTTNQLVDVGRGIFKVPSLIGVGARAPYLHDGCAATLMDRFTTCAHPSHGNTANLSATQLTDLIAFLESL